jgi:hypothetical protein
MVSDIIYQSLITKIFYKILPLLFSSLLKLSYELDTQLFVIIGSLSKIVSASSLKALQILLRAALLFIFFLLALLSSSSSDDIVRHSKN